jgi:hypothetical protein
VLAADSRFCHKCGKPQYEEDVERLAALEAEMKPVAAPVAEPVVAPVPIGIGNLRAVGVTMSVAALAFVCMLLASVVAPPIVPIILCAAGFAAARFYKGNSSISAFAGAVLGTMTGMWLFLVFAVCAAMASYSLESPEGQQMMKAFSPKITPDVARILQDPHQMVTGLLLPTFFLLVISAAFGGLLAARFRWRGRQQ